MTARAAAATILGVVCGVAVGAGSPQDRPTFRADVRLIDVDVVATDRNGNAVRDLTIAEFEILEEGRPQKIQAFAAIDLPVVQQPNRESSLPEIEPDVATNAGPEGRLYVILLDAPAKMPTVPFLEGDSYTVRAKQVARQFVRTAIQPGDQVAVVHVQGTFTDSQPFTTSRRLIEASIERYGRGRSGVDGIGGDKLLRHLDTYRAIEDLSARLGTIRRRRKAIIWIGGQIDINPEAKRLDAPEVGVLNVAYRDAMRAAARNNVAIYPIDPVGVSTELGQDELNRMAGLRSVAEDTGGLAVVNTNNFAGGFAAVIQDLSVYYMLGYTPDREYREGSFHPITVRVKRSGVVVRARRGYYTGPAAGPSQPSRAALPRGVSTAIADALVRPLPTKDLRIDVLTSAFKTTRRERDVIISARVDAQRLRLDPGASLALAYQIFDIEGRVVTGRYKVFGLDLRPRTRAAAAEGGLQFFDRVALRPGRYELRLAAEQPNVALGSVLAHVDVPGFDEPLGMSGVILAISSTETAVTLTSDASLRQALTADPTTLRRFHPRDTLLAFAEIYSEKPDDATGVAVTLVSTAGVEAARAVATAITQQRDTQQPARRYRVALDLQSVPPGQYVLTMDARSVGRADRSVRRQILLTVEP